MSTQQDQLEHFLNQLSNTEQTNSDAINALYQGIFPKQDLSSEDYRAQTCQFLLQANLFLMEKFCADNAHHGDKPWLNAIVNETINELNNKLSTGIENPQTVLTQFTSMNPLQTLSELVNPASEEGAIIMRQLILLSFLQPVIINQEAKFATLLKRFVLDRKPSPATTTSSSFESNIQASVAASSSSTVSLFGIDDESGYFVIIDGEKVINRALNDAVKLIEQQQQINDEEMHALGDGWRSIEVTVDKDDTYPLGNAFECPINAEIMQGQESGSDNKTTPFIYRDGNSYAKELLNKDLNESPLTREPISTSILNQPLIDAEARYYQLVTDFQRMQQFKRNQKSAAPASSRSSATSSNPVASSSSSSSSSNEQDKKGKGKLRQRYELTDEVRQNYNKQLALRYFLRDKVRTGELDSNNPQVNNLQTSNAFSLTIARDNYPQLETEYDEKIIKAMIAQMLALPPELVDEYFREKALEIDVNDRLFNPATPHTEHPELERELQRLQDRRKAIDLEYPLMREWAKLKKEMQPIKHIATVNLPIDKLSTTLPTPIPENSNAYGFYTKYDYLYKLLLVGDAGVGKTSLLLRFAEDVFIKPSVLTIGVDFKIRTINNDGKITKLQIWDTQGEEQFTRIGNNRNYRGAQAVLLCFDVTDRISFNHCKDWLKEIERYTLEHTKVVLVATKLDDTKERVVSPQEAIEFANTNGLAYQETSAKEGYGVDEAIYQATAQIYDQLKPENEAASSSSHQPVETNDTPAQNRNSFFNELGTSIAEGFSSAFKSIFK